MLDYVLCTCLHSTSETLPGAGKIFKKECKLFGSDRSFRNANVFSSGTKLSKILNLHLSGSESNPSTQRELREQSESIQICAGQSEVGRWMMPFE